MIKIRSGFGIIILLLVSCIPDKTNDDNIIKPVQIEKTVTPDAETDPVLSAIGIDAADDIAIWYNSEEPDSSLIIGANKMYGIEIYNLNGKRRKHYSLGKVNNIDLRYDYKFNDGSESPVIVCSNRTTNEVQIFALQTSDKSLREISGGRLVSGGVEVYGICMYKSPYTGIYYAFVNDITGLIEQWELIPYENNEITGKVVRELFVESKPEGMVSDDSLALLYVGEEKRGIWQFLAEPDSGKNVRFIVESDTSNNQIEFDIEGLTIFYGSNEDGYLIASSQGNNSYAIFERKSPNSYIGSFTVVSGVIDGTEDTDGIDVMNYSLGSYYPNGLFIVQDGYNYDNSSYSVQNFKLISWSKIANLFDPPLLLHPYYIK